MDIFFVHEVRTGEIISGPFAPFNAIEDEISRLRKGPKHRFPVKIEKVYACSIDCAECLRVVTDRNKALVAGLAMAEKMGARMAASPHRDSY